MLKETPLETKLRIQIQTVEKSRYAADLEVLYYCIQKILICVFF
jgi:hypothetical protein